MFVSFPHTAFLTFYKHLSKAITAPPSRATQRSFTHTARELPSVITPARSHHPRALWKGNRTYSSRSKRFYITLHYNIAFCACQVVFQKNCVSDLFKHQVDYLFVADEDGFALAEDVGTEKGGVAVFFKELGVGFLFKGKNGAKVAVFLIG